MVIQAFHDILQAIAAHMTESALGYILPVQVPYSDMTPLQAAVGVVQKGLRPGIPPGCPPALADLLVGSWQQSPAARPSFRELTPRLQVRGFHVNRQDRANAAVSYQALGRHCNCMRHASMQHILGTLYRE